MPTEDIYLVFVCYNCGRDIAEVLNDLQKGDYPLEKIHVVVVDNASSDDSLNAIRAAFWPGCELLESPENLGFAGGCNLALQSMPEEGKVLLLNPDIGLRKDSITALVSYSDQTPEAGIWGGITTLENGEYDGRSAWREPTIGGLFFWAFLLCYLPAKLGFRTHDSYLMSDLERNPSVEAVSGCFMLLDLALVHKLQGFDERFFMYSEEIDLCRRAREAGYAPRVCLEARITHKGGITLTSARKRQLLLHSKMKYLNKHWSKPAALLGHSVLLFGCLIRTLGFAVISVFNPRMRAKARSWWNIFSTQLGTSTP